MIDMYYRVRMDLVNIEFYCDEKEVICEFWRLSNDLEFYYK